MFDFDFFSGLGVKPKQNNVIGETRHFEVKSRRAIIDYRCYKKKKVYVRRVPHYATA